MSSTANTLPGCRCSKNLGIIQFACIPDPESFKGSTMTLVFKVSLVNQNKQISCGANQALQIVSAEVGAGRSTKVTACAVFYLSGCNHHAMNAFQKCT
jgi:hypothetical protein